MDKLKFIGQKKLISELLGNTLYIKAIYLVMIIFSHCVLIEDYITPFNKVVLLYGVLVIVYDLFTSRNTLRNRYFLLLVAFCFFIFLSIVINFQEGLVANIKGFSYLVLEFFVIAMIFPQKSKESVVKEFKILATIAIVCLSVLGIGAFYAFLMGLQIPLGDDGRFFIGVSPDSRLFGISGNPNMLGLQMMFLLMLVMTSFVISESKRKWYWLFPGILGVVCLMLSGFPRGIVGIFFRGRILYLLYFITKTFV